VTACCRLIAGSSETGTHIDRAGSSELPGNDTDAAAAAATPCKIAAARVEVPSAIAAVCHDPDG
jgi:hypothetical protein